MLNLSLLQSASSWTIALAIFFLVIIFYMAGHHFRKRKIAKNPEHAKIELGTINGILMGMLGLLLAFTFGMSNSRFDKRRDVVIEEANDIGTAVLRADLYPDSIRNLLRENFSNYVEARIAFYQAGVKEDEIVKYYLQADNISKILWNIVSADAKTNSTVVRTGQMIPALNAMIDITTTRRAAGESTIPDSIMYFLFFLCLCSSFLIGYDNKGKTDWTVVLGFSVILSIIILLIVDLDRPRSGFINMDTPNQKIIELRGMFNEK
jgi:cbb3-type cytochrome oxidase subunit 3